MSANKLEYPRLNRLTVFPEERYRTSSKVDSVPRIRSNWNRLATEPVKRTASKINAIAVTLRCDFISGFAAQKSEPPRWWPRQNRAQHRQYSSGPGCRLPHVRARPAKLCSVRPGLGPDKPLPKPAILKRPERARQSSSGLQQTYRLQTTQKQRWLKKWAL